MNYINIKTIMNRITRHPLMQDLPFETVVDYIVDFIRIVGVPNSFIDKTEVLEVDKYRAELPCDFYKMTQVRLLKACGQKWEGLLGGMFRYTTDSFHMSDIKPEYSELTYKIQGGMIYVAPMEKCTIEIAYQAMPVDDDGYPMLPDNSAYLRAAELYIKSQWFTVQFDLGKISPQVLNKAEQDYCWAVGQAQSSMIMPSIDELESITNMWNSLLVRSQHRTGFKNLGNKEHLKNH